MESEQEVIMSNEINMTLSTHLLIIKNSELLSSINPEEKSVIVFPPRSRCYLLSVTGSRIWELTNEPITVGHLVNTLLDEYEIDRMTCEIEVFSFLAHLSKEKLIQFAM